VFLSGFNVCVSLQSKMVMHDKLEFEKAEARNSVEEYVYDMRGKLYEKYQECVSEEVRVTAESLVFPQFFPA